METKYIDITNIATPEDLYKVMVEKVQPIVDEETLKREKIVAEYNEFCKPFMEQFNIETAAEQEEAKKYLEKPKADMDKAIAAIKRKAEEAVDKEVKKYIRHQTRAQNRFENKTTAATEKYNAAIAEMKAKVEAELDAIGKDVTARIEPINAEYRVLAEMMEQNKQ